MNPASATPENRQRLLALLDRVAAIAGRAKPFFRRATLLCALCALWLAWSLQQAAATSTLATLVVVGVLLLPALVLGWLWSLLADLGQLPEQAQRAMGGVQRMVGREPERVDGAAVAGVFRLRGSLREAAQLAWDLEGVRGVIVGVLVLTNPLFLLLIAAALAFGVLEIAVALVTALFALF